MRKVVFVAMYALLAVASSFADVSDVYNFKMHLKVPRVYNNTGSLGYRKYQTQTITGTMTITYSKDSTPEIKITNLFNKTHKMSNGQNVTYTCTVGDSIYNVFTRVNVIGDNKKNLFKTASIDFHLDAMPNYSRGGDDEDNSLIVRLSGKGTTSVKSGTRYIHNMSGYVTGTLGCGCTAYEHISPTRVMGMYGPTTMVDDVASVFGTWKAVRVKKYSCDR